MKTASASLALLALVLYSAPALAQSTNPPATQFCPLKSTQTNASKSNTLYLYFPAADDYGFAYRPPVAAFNAAALNPALTDTPGLIERIHTVVADDYCEFNVAVTATTSNPEVGANGAKAVGLPPYHSTVAIGADATGGTYWGMTPPGPTNPGYARVWAGYYGQCEGGSYVNGVLGSTCPATTELKGANATVERWAQAIGGTAAHEAGHTYGLAHDNEDPPGVPDEPGGPPLQGEDPYNKHLMPAGEYLVAADRVGYRRHFGDVTYGLLATQVGLVMETMQNWDLQNPNQAAGYKLSIDFLSLESSVTIDWDYEGMESPWINPVVEKLKGSTTFQGVVYNNYRITWSTPNPAFSGTPGVVAGGGGFHIGATFTGVDFNQPNAIVVGAVTLYGDPSLGGAKLVLHPRLPQYDAGTLDSNGVFALTMRTPPGGVPMQLKSARLYQLPRVASIESMIGTGKPRSFDGLPIKPWTTAACAPGSLGDPRRCLIAHREDRAHVLVEHHLGQPGVVDCADPAALLRRLHDHFPEGRLPQLRLPPALESAKDSSVAPDQEGAVCAGTQRDPFPATTVYLVATFVDPRARHYDRLHRRYVTGPVTSKVFYQFAGVRHPDQPWHSPGLLLPAADQ